VKAKEQGTNSSLVGEEFDFSVKFLENLVVTIGFYGDGVSREFSSDGDSEESKVEFSSDERSSLSVNSNVGLNPVNFVIEVGVCSVETGLVQYFEVSSFKLIKSVE